MNKKIWLLLSLIICLSSPLYAGLVISGANSNVNYSIVYKSTFQSNVSTSVINNVVAYGTNMEFDDSATLKNSISINTGENDITIATGKTVTGTSNIFEDSGKSGSGTYTNAGGTLWSTDPKFVSTSNFNLLASSPAINTGVNVCSAAGVPFAGCTGSGTGTYFDYAGTVVPQGSAPDIGAYEWSGGGSRMRRGVGK